MKITLLELNNFSAIYVGLRRERLRLDFSKFTNIITILVGEMGSGKTTILSQLHPWSSIGVLDERNSDQLIRSERDGMKHIVFKDGTDEFDIVHKYTWTKDHHSTKSFFKYNGNELNPNGNVSSFKDLVTKFMGVDQSYLRITRLGPNVSNLIDMPWNQRKTYVASMIENVDIYTNILVEIRNKIKNCDAELTVITKQVMDVSDEELANMKEQAASLDKTVENESQAVLKMYADLQQLSSANDKLVTKYLRDHNSTMADLQEKLIRGIDRDKAKLETLNSNIQELDNGIDMNKLMMDMGSYSTKIDTIKTNRSLLEDQLNEISTEIDKLETKKLNAADSVYMQSLITNYEDLIVKLNGYNEELAGYHMELSPAEINTLLADIRTLDEAIYSVRSYNKEIVNDLVKRNVNPTKYANEQIEKLQNKIVLLKRQIENMRFIDGYDVTMDLPEVKAPACLACPYYKTHPNVMKKTTAGKTEAKIREKQLEISECQSKIAAFEDYSIVDSKIKQCEKLFYEIKPRVQKLKALKITDIKVIMSTINAVWYDYDTIINELERAVHYVDSNHLSIKVVELESEIKKYETLNLDDILKQIQEKSNFLEDTKLAIKECDSDIDTYNAKIDELSTIIHDYEYIDDLKKEATILDNTIESNTQLLKTLDADIEEFAKNSTEYSELNGRYIELQGCYSAHSDALEKLSRRIDVVDNGKKQINALQEQKYLYELIKEASSPQTGIPLLYVQMFLNDCISITNQLISMVLDDTIEIMGLDLSKPDMKIPYRKNGEVMEDVKSASQGERAAISLALSFAFMHKCLSMNKGTFNYNILLLDEIDAPFDSSARDRCIQILAQQIKVNNVEQVFFITHNDRYDGYPVNVIATTETNNIRKDVPLIKLY